MSGAVLYIQDDLQISSTQVEILVGSLNVCSLLGSLASGKTSDCIGRRYTILLSATTFLVGAILMGLAPSFKFLMVGRVVAGIGVGFSLMIAPVYTTEISPSMSRGLLSSLPEVFINVGILLGYISNYALSCLPQHVNWRLMLGLAALPAVIVAFGVMAMPESPRWLALNGRFAEAKQVLLKISDTEEEAAMRMTEMVQATSSSNSPIGGGVWKELLINPSQSLRRILFVAIGINFFMQASGNDAVVYYSPLVFKEAGISSKKQLMSVTILMGIAKTSFCLVSSLFLDNYGRRPLLLLSASGITVSLSLLALGSKYLQQSNTKPTWAIALCIVSVCADVSFFSIGLGPVTWVYSSEIFPTKFRAQGSSIAISVNRLVSGIVSMTFLTISQEITFGGMFFALACIMAMGSLFIYLFLPETKGKSLEDIGNLFEE